MKNQKKSGGEEKEELEKEKQKVDQKRMIKRKNKRLH